jgi:hypothetical protein
MCISALPALCSPGPEHLLRNLGMNAIAHKGITNLLSNYSVDVICMEDITFWYLCLSLVKKNKSGVFSL